MNIGPTTQSAGLPFEQTNLAAGSTTDDHAIKRVHFTEMQVAEGKPEEDVGSLFFNVEIQHDLAIVKNIVGVRVLDDRTYLLSPDFDAKLLADFELAALTRVLFGILYQPDARFLKLPALLSSRMQELTDRLGIEQIARVEVILQALMDRHHELFQVSAPGELNTPEMHFHIARVPQLVSELLEDIRKRKENRLEAEIGVPVTEYLEAQLLRWESTSSNLEELAREVANSLNGLRDITHEKSSNAIDQSLRSLYAFRATYRHRLQRLRVEGVTADNFLTIRHVTYLQGDLASQKVIEGAIHRRLNNMVRFSGNREKGPWREANERDSRIHRLFCDLESMQDALKKMKNRATPLDIEATDLTRLAISDTWRELFGIWDEYAVRVRKDLEQGDSGYYGLIRRYAALAAATARARRLDEIYFSLPDPVRYWTDSALSGLLINDIAFQNKQIQMRHDHIRDILNEVHKQPGVHLLGYRVSALEELRDVLNHLPDSVKDLVSSWDLRFAAAKSLRRVRKLSKRYADNPAVRSANILTLSKKRETGMLSQDKRITERWKERIDSWSHAWK